LLLTAIVLEKVVFLTTTSIVGRHRPLTQLGTATVTSSFPSGHVGSAVVFYVVIAVVVSWHVRTASIRALAWTIAVSIPIAVALSRMLLGLHYLTDVIAGGALGGVSVIVGYFLALRSIDDLQARTIGRALQRS
jgi:undecaprenyl-diphosphatase